LKRHYPRETRVRRVRGWVSLGDDGHERNCLIWKPAHRGALARSMGVLRSTPCRRICAHSLRWEDQKPSRRDSCIVLRTLNQCAGTCPAWAWQLRHKFWSPPIHLLRPREAPERRLSTLRVDAWPLSVAMPCRRQASGAPDDRSYGAPGAHAVEKAWA